MSVEKTRENEYYDEGKCMNKQKLTKLEKYWILYDVKLGFYFAGNYHYADLF